MSCVIVCCRFLMRWELLGCVRMKLSCWRCWMFANKRNHSNFSRIYCGLFNLYALMWFWLMLLWCWCGVVGLMLLGFQETFEKSAEFYTTVIEVFSVCGDVRVPVFVPNISKIDWFWFWLTDIASVPLAVSDEGSYQTSSSQLRPRYQRCCIGTIIL